MKRRLVRALGVALAVGAFSALLHAWGVGLPLLIGLACLLGGVAFFVPWLGVRLLDRVFLAARATLWRREQGKHHSFGGVALHIEDDGRHVWIAGADLQQVLGTKDRDDVLAARVPGRWRHDEGQPLLLRVDAVVAYLAAAPGRMEPRIVRLRRYLEREVLFPAAEKRRRSR